MKFWYTLLIFIIFHLSIFAQHKNILIDNTGTPNEPSIAINPKNPAQLVAGSNIDNCYFSSDTGKTWTENKIESAYGVWGDPAITVDTNGYFYFFHLSTAQHWIDRIVAQRSDDGGKTWTQDSYMGFFIDKDQDKEWPVVDPLNNNIYVSWTQFDAYGSKNANDSTHILFSKSTDAGKTWSDAKRLDQKGGDCVDSDNTVEGAVPAVGPNGEIYIAWAGPLGLMFDRSLDEGETWLDKDIFVSDIPGGWDYDIPGISRCNGLPVTVCDLSESAYRGNIYINWTDQRNGEDDTDVWMVRSSDGGNTWTQAVRVNDDLPGRHQFLTWMTIDQKTGYLYFVFYDRRNYSDNNTDVYMAISKDGGDTFENFKISESPFKPKQGAFFGDYTNITASNNIIRPIWTRLDGFKLSLWTADVNIDSITTSNDDIDFSKDLLEVYQNSPNPYKDKTAISFKIHKGEKISLSIYDSLGMKIMDYFTDQYYDEGKHIIILDNKKLRLKPGIYFYSLRYDNYIKTKKMIIAE
ncbi:MAG TPA: T9SS type A sorting domain-containing protein [Bacteroidetes bacterium]|nr:T9SS type A sorting domain-containing protein [Bacteroidota bacterium]